MAQPEEIAGPRQRRGEVHHQHGAAVAAQLCERAPVAQQRNGREENGGGQERQQDDSEEIDALKDMAEIDVAKRLRHAEHQDQCGTEKCVMPLCHDFLRCGEHGGEGRQATPDFGTRFLRGFACVIPARPEL